MDEERILSSLRRENPWWRGEKIELGSHYYKRSHYYNLRQQIDEEEIIGLLGPRRVGKTTILKQIAQYLVKEKNVSRNRILFIQMDNPYLKNSLEQPLKTIFEVYQDYILEDSFENLEEPVYVFLDEVQVLDSWAERLKYWYDRDYNLSLTITGSSSAKITAGSESLLGRIMDRKMLPLKFSETIKMKQECGGLELKLQEKRKEMKNSFKKAINEENPEALKKTFVKNTSSLRKHKSKIKPELERYLKRGGYPRIIQKEIREGLDLDYASRKLENDAEKAIQKDASDIYEASPQKLMKVAVFIADNTGQKLVKSNLAGFAGVSEPTAAKYLNYLQEAYIIHRTKHYSPSTAASERKQQKSYIWDPGFRNALIGSLGGEYNMPPGEKGLVVESVCADHLKRLTKQINGANQEVCYWDYQGGEVDLIINIANKTLPIEVKYQDSINKSGLKGLNRFLYDQNTEYGIVITKDKTGIMELREGKAVLTPLWILLTMI